MGLHNVADYDTALPTGVPLGGGYRVAPARDAIDQTLTSNAALDATMVDPQRKAPHAFPAGEDRSETAHPLP